MRPYSLLCAILAGFAIGIPCRCEEAPRRVLEAGGSENATALEVMTLVAQDILALKDSFRELSELTIELPLRRPLIFYQYRTVYVPAQPTNHSYWRVKTGGCRFTIECFSAGEAGWPGVPVGPSTSNADWPLRQGGRLMAFIDTSDQLLRETIMAILARRFANYRLQGTADRRP